MKLNDLENIEFSDNSRLSFNHNLSRLNWFNIGGKTRIFLLANSLKDLSIFLNKYNNRGKIFVLGAGSNTLFNDNTFDGAIIKLGKNFNNISKLNENLIPYIIECAKNRCTLGEISDTLRKVFGEYS